MIKILAGRDGLYRLRELFVNAGFDIRVVGGAVRSYLLHEVPSDFDLCTNATPDEQIEIYTTNGYRWIPTGLSHGTVTVVVPNEDRYEITTLRSERDHDGRHATVQFERDWTLDQARRDLTINQIAMDFNGTIYDPFGGVADLEARRVRFVGDPEERMREDYLRILRWLRFHGRVAGDLPLDPDASEAALRVASGLEGISRERVWMEMSKIVCGPAAGMLLNAIQRLGIGSYVKLPEGDTIALNRAIHQELKPASRMAAYLGHDLTKVQALAFAWKWSTEEAQTALFLCRTLPAPQYDYLRHSQFQPRLRSQIIELAKAQDRSVTAEFLTKRSFPSCPVTGDDLIASGVKPGPQIKALLNQVQQIWYDGGCSNDRDVVLKISHQVLDQHRDASG